jgi:hypothetical protein
LLWFTAAITLFHFGNAAMLPLAGDKLRASRMQAAVHGLLRGHGAACMVPMTILVGRKAGAWGRSRFFWPGSPSRPPATCLPA